jgi:hypothetical protein
MVKNVMQLFLVTTAYDNVSSSISMIQRMPDKESIVVIALDFWAAKKLRQKGIPYKTPDEYLDISTCEDIDVKAIEMTQTWYRSLGEKLTYKNIPLGQMAESDFGQLFIETMRSIEVATRILSHESPGMLLLPAFPQSELFGLSTMCYRTLPEVLHYLAKSMCIPVTMLKPDSKAIFRSKMHSLKSLVDFLVRGITMLADKMYRGIPFMLRAKGKNVILFASGPLHRRVFTELNKGENACLDIFLISWPPTSIAARRKIKELHNLWEEFAQCGATSRTLTYNSVPLFEIFNYRFQQFFHAQAPALIGYIEWADKLIRVLKPDILVVFDDASTISRAFCRTFKHHGVPVLVMQHGVLTVKAAALSYFLTMPLEAPRQAVWGNACREEWGSKRGKPAECQVVVGNPKYDFVAEGYRPKKSEICRKLGLDPERGIIVVATEYYGSMAAAYTTELEERFIRGTIKALINFPDKQIVIKLHPTFHKKYRQIVSAIAEEENLEVTITSDYLWELLAVSDLVIISESTVGLDAMVLDKPVVVVNLSKCPDGIAYVSKGAARGAYRPEDIAPVVREVLNNEQVRRELAEARKRFVYEYAYIQDGKASRRVAELIRQMIQNKRVMELEQACQK